MQYFVSRSAAKARGLKTYNGKPCKNGHRTGERYTSNGGCILCDRGAPPDAEPEAEKPPALLTAETGFVWSDAVRQQIIDRYIDTGDIEGARQSVSLAPSEYHRELKRNDSFAEAIKEATKLAMQTVEERAIHEAAKGNDKLILAVLKAKHPEQYTDRVKVEQVTDKLSDAEIDRRLNRLLGLIPERTTEQPTKH